MKQHEREYFISRIRSGYYSFKIGNLKLKLYPPTIEDELEANLIYAETYDECKTAGILSEEEMTARLIEMGEWSHEQQEKVDKLPEDLDRFRVEIYNHRYNKDMREKARKILRIGEKQLTELLNKRAKYRENTCEGQAFYRRSQHLTSSCTYVGDELYDFSDITPMSIWQNFISLLLEEHNIRELARKEPWSSIWALRDTDSYSLFNTNGGRELSIDQRNLLIWSKTYDNIAESHEAPADDVVDDHDMLDGWFIIKRRERERERLKNEMDNKGHLNNADEVFMMAKDKEGADRINKMNDPHSQGVKQQRFKTIQERGEVAQHDFLDERLKIRTQHNQAFKDKFRNG